MSLRAYLREKPAFQFLYRKLGVRLLLRVIAHYFERRDSYRLYFIPYADFLTKFQADVISMPDNVFLVGWDVNRQKWLLAVGGAERKLEDDVRLEKTLFYLRKLLPSTKKQIWFFLCCYDGFREHVPYQADYKLVPVGNLRGQLRWLGEAGEVPEFSRSKPWVFAYARHKKEPFTQLLPEAHYLIRRNYKKLRRAIDRRRVPWEQKHQSFGYFGGGHGSITNYIPPVPADRPHPRAYFKQLVDQNVRPVFAREFPDVKIDVYLRKSGELGLGMLDQLNYKFLINIDGETATWDAFFWKLYSGSTVLMQESIWETFFTPAFTPWEHYVPLANDFSDLAEKMRWCLTNDQACQKIADRAYTKATEVYDPIHVLHKSTRSFTELLFAERV